MKHWVVINRLTLGTDDPDAVRIFGSIEGIKLAKLMVDGEPLTYDMLRNRISETRRWVSDKWIIEENEVIRNKRVKKEPKKNKKS